MESTQHEVRPLKILVSEKVGTVSAELILPSKPLALLTLAHGAGSNMNHYFLLDLSLKLAAQNIGSIRFNFPYTERKKKMPDKPPVATQTVRAVVEKVYEQFPVIPLFLSGKSFGGRMSSQLLASYCPPYVKGIAFYGFPLHPPGNPSVERAAHLKEISIPMLFLQGTKDDLARWELIEEVCSSLPNSTLVKIQGANHSFKAGKHLLIDDLILETVSWIKNHA
jgi:uncharacterized protein